MSSRLIRIISSAMSTARSEIPADTRYPLPNPKASAWLLIAVWAAVDRCAPLVAAMADFVFDATADHATVPSIARPIDPPTCCPVLSSDDATPVSLFGTFASATSDSGTNVSPIPRPVSIIGPSRPPAYELCSVTRDSQNMPTAASSGPPVISGRAPIRATSCEESAAPTTIMPTIGRYAIPERTGEYPQTSCTKIVMKKNMPKIAVPMHRLMMYAAVLSRDLSTRGGTSACRDRASMNANAPSSTTAATSDTMTLVFPQCETACPLANVVAASESPYTRAP